MLGDHLLYSEGDLIQLSAIKYPPAKGISAEAGLILLFKANFCFFKKKRFFPLTWNMYLLK